MISVVVPIYNAQNSLKKCVESILNQSYGNLEIILVNDGSSDNSLKICKELSRFDQRIRIINQNNLGVSVARNRGIKEASGKFIQFVDSDDYIDENMCGNMLDCIISNEADLVVCGFNSVTPWRNHKVNFKKKQYNYVHELEKDFEYLFENAFFHSMCNKLYKKAYIFELLEEGLSIGEDLQFNLNYLKNVNKIVTLDNCYYNYIHNYTSSLSKLLYKNELEIIENRYKKIFDFCQSYFDSRYYECFLYKRMIYEVLSTFKKIISNNPSSIYQFYIFKEYLLEHEGEIFKAKQTGDKKMFLLFKKKYKFIWIKLIIESLLDKVKLDIKKRFIRLKT